MKRRPKLSLILIALLFIFCLLINLSDPFTLSLPNPVGGKTLTYNFPGLTFMNKLGRDFSFRRGLDLQGGTSITMQANMQDIASTERDSALESVKNVIERRINFLGVSEPVVQTSKTGSDYRVLVEIPGVTDVNQAVQLVGKTAKLTFWEAGPVPASGSAKVATDAASLLKLGLPLGVPQVIGPYAIKTNLSGTDLKQATVTFDRNTGKPQVELTFTADGARKFGEITKRNTGKVVAIALDNELIEAPRVNEPIFGGNAVISGQFTTDQANSLQIQLNAGALPVSLSVLQQRAINATLGKVSVEKSLVAGLIGFLVIVVFMVVLYGRLGIIASMALTVYTLTVLTLFRLIPITLTLAGIAGFILSVGIAVDANILIFERMKEELRKGRSNASAIDLGFSRAWLSIRDSNMASLITSGVLFYFGTGVVRGFAFTLALGIFVSLFSAIVVTKTFLGVFYKGGKENV